MTMLDQAISHLFTTCLMTSVLLFSAGAEPDAVERGRQILKDMCSKCHSIDKAGRSPHSGAPAFREIDVRVDLDEFTDRLRKGLHSGYKNMSSVRFTRDDARAIVAYLRSIQAP
jgi:mono/diheme cytochrome c family protein